MISENSDFRAISQIIKTNILLLHHPREITASIMYPNIWMACFIIVIKQTLHSSTTPLTLALPRHVCLVDLLALQSLRRPRLQGVDFLQDGSNSHLKLYRLVTQVPDPRPRPRHRHLCLIPASIEASHHWDKADFRHVMQRGGEGWLWLNIRWWNVEDLWWGQPTSIFYSKNLVSEMIEISN